MNHMTIGETYIDEQDRDFRNARKCPECGFAMLDECGDEVNICPECGIEV